MDRLIAAWRGFVIIGLVLAIAALYDAYRRKKSPGPHAPKKLTRREAFWIILIVIILVLLGLPIQNCIGPSRFSSQPVNTK